MRDWCRGRNRAGSRPPDPLEQARPRPEPDPHDNPARPRIPRPPHANNQPVGKRRIPDEYTLLCDRCGYDIESLPKDAACPECGKPIRESLPEARTGTPWQSRPSLLAALETWRRTLIRPGRAFAEARAEPDPSLLFLTLITACAAIAALVFVAVLPLDEPGIPVSGGSMTIISKTFMRVLWPIMLAVAAWPVLRFLTWIEERGIRFWGPKRGWRITPAIAKVICAHASVGWLLGSLLSIPAHLLGLAMLEWTNHNNAGILRGPMQLAPITLPALSFIAGMLTFEVLVYIAMNRMKFANRARPEKTPPLDASVPTASVPSDSIVHPRSVKSPPPSSSDTPSDTPDA